MKLTIYATTDIHGYMVAQSHSPSQGSFARVAQFIEDRRAAEESFLLIENGDFLEGSLLAHYLKWQEESWQVHPFIEQLNLLRYDVAVPGNHEFNYGLDFINHSIQSLECPYLAANIVDAKSGEPYWQSYKIVEKAGVKVAILGLVTSYITRWEPYERIKEIRILDPVGTAEKWINFLQKNEEYDLLILAYHGGIERNLLTGEESQYPTGEDEGYHLAELAGVDGVIAGHQHRLIAGKVGNVPIVEAGTKGEAIGALTFELEQKDRKKWHKIKSEAKLISLKEYPEATHVREKMQPWIDKMQADISLPFEPLGIKDLVSLLHQIQQVVSNQKISAVSLYNSKDKVPNPSFQTLIQNFSFPNTFATLRVTKEEMQKLLTVFADYYEFNQAERLSPYPKGTKVNKEELFEGLDYSIKKQNDTVEIDILSDQNTFEWVFNHYQLTLAKKAGIGTEHIIQEFMIFLPDLLLEYLQTGKIKVPVSGIIFKEIKAR